ncbi:uncharacterized protein LOC109535060 isoform X2 [Dendroctonus ponderosae]|uniref:uncharacterized protein LOC109535060 isoform X2 n=1 Tax=Dendroctonus ponderosae TaxID=77166 RepID=UPI0020364A53|nr:uncharacterized protein LOC109535060 isoform X2 [Dendroctonus ponderosae]
MAPKTAICRICVQETDNNDLQDLDWKNIDPFLANNYLQRPLDLYKGHVICCSCIDNFNTISKLHRLVAKSNSVLTRLKASQLDESASNSEINLKEILASDVGDDMAICRVCLDTTKHVAIRLFDSATNIVPPDYLKSMFSEMNINLLLIDQTKTPIICYQCWQRLQISYSFHKHLGVAISKLRYYQRISQNMYLSQMDLDDILYMWDKLDEPDHDYCNNHSVDNEIFVNEEIVGTNTDQISDMPVLQPNSHDSMDSLKTDSSKRSLLNKIVIKENRTVSVKKINQKKNKNRIRVSDSIANRTTNRRESNPVILRSALLSKTVPNIPILQPAENSDMHKRYNLRSSRSINFKEEDILDEDLLVLRKQVVIKAKPAQTKMPSLNNMDALPPILQNQSIIERPTNGYHSNDYTFERLNFDSYVLMDKNRVPEQEIQIKAEVLSDSDDDFVEETPGIFTETEQPNGNGDGVCPSLVGFVKTESEELIDVTGIEEQPPELEFQGPCSNMPNLTILNAYTSVEEKRRTIESFDETQLNDTEVFSNGAVEKQNANEHVNQVVPDPTYSNCDIEDMPQLDSNCDPLRLDVTKKTRKSHAKKGRAKSMRSSVLQDADQNDDMYDYVKPKTRNKPKAVLPYLPYACTKCDYLSNTKRAMTFHDDVHNASKAKILVCEFCSFIAINKDTFRRHRRNHLENKDHDYCYECKLHTPTIYCLKCSKDFHPQCLLAHQTKSKECIHFNIEGVLTICKREIATLAPPDSSGGNLSCTYCKKMASKSFINCQLCVKQFHYECFFARDKKCLNVCMHLVRLLRRMYIKSEGSKVRCTFCERILEYVTPCLSCQCVMHYSCYSKHAELVTSNCNHAHIIHGLPLDFQYLSPPQLTSSSSYSTKLSKISEFKEQFYIKGLQ